MAAAYFAAPVLLRQTRGGNGYQARAAWPGLALVVLLVLAASLTGCSAIDPSRVTVNVDPEEFSSVGW
jgi:hypothetical protein